MTFFFMLNTKEITLKNVGYHWLDTDKNTKTNTLLYVMQEKVIQVWWLNGDRLLNFGCNIPLKFSKIVN